MEKETANTELIRGHVDTIILRTLQNKDSYPYDILKEIEEKSCGKYVLKQATLYSCMKRLERVGYINSYWGTESEGGRRRYYSLTELGKDFLQKDQIEWEYSRTLINNLLSDKEVDLSAVPPPFDASALRPLTKRGQTSAAQTGDEDTILNDEQNNSVVDTPEFIPIDASAKNNNQVSTEDKPLRFVPQQTAQEETFAEAATNNDVDNKVYITKTPIFFHNQKDAQDDGQSSAEDKSVFRFNPMQNEEAEPIVLAEPKEEQHFRTEEENLEMHAAANLLQIGEYRKSYSEVANTTESDILPRNYPSIAKPNAGRAQDNYRETLGKIFDKEVSGNGNKMAEEPSAEVALPPIKGRHIKDLQNNLAKQGYNLKIYSPKNRADYYYNKYIYQNKINFFAAAIMFALLMVQYIVIVAFNRSIGFSSAVLTIAGCFIAAFFGVTVVAFLVNPSKRIRANYNFIQSMIYRLVIMLILISVHTIICLVTPSLGITFSDLRLYLPWILSLNIPLYAIVYNILYLSKKFHLTCPKFN